MTSKFCTTPDGIEYYYYRCINSVTKGCNAKLLSEKNTEKFVIENVKKELEKFILSNEVSASKQNKKPSDVAKLKEQLRRVNVAYYAGNMEDDEYIKKTKEIKAMIDKATAEEQSEKPLDLTFLKEFLNSDFENIYSKLNKREQQKLWRSIIDELICEDNKVVGIKFKA